MPFPFFELSLQDGAPPKEFEGMSVGTFTDMWGREYAFPLEDMPKYAANTQAAIMATMGSDGEPVGLPIVPRGHYNDMDAAGWIIGARLNEAGDKLLFTPRWTAEGERLISGNYQRFFSGSIDVDNKTVLGGSLTNWPATRNKAGQVLLRPVELSQGVYSFEIDREPTSLLADLVSYLKSIFGAKPAADLNQPEKETEPMADVAELTQEQIAQLDAVIADRAKSMFEAQLAKYQREAGIAEFTRKATAQGLPVEAETLTAFLSSLSAEQAESAQSLINTILEKGVVPFAELGHSREMGGKKTLSPEIKLTLAEFKAAGGTVEEFFQAAEIGKPEDFDLEG